MIRPASHFLLLLLATALPALADANAGAKAPIVNFSLPTFTIPDGYRDLLVRGSEATMTAQNTIDVKELSLSIFSRDASNQIESLMLSPAARFLSDEQIVTGNSTLRVINLHDGIDVTGTGWRYTHKDKTVVLHKKVRVVFGRELKDLLK